MNSRLIVLLAWQGLVGAGECVVDDDDSSIYSDVDDDDSSSYSEVTFGTTGQHNFPSWVLHAPPPDAMMCLSDLYIYTKQQKNILM